MPGFTKQSHGYQTSAMWLKEAASDLSGSIMTGQGDKLNDAINAWMEERQELVVLYCSTCGVHQKINESATKIQRLKTFCQIMVDYCSAGHFVIFPELVKRATGSQAVLLEKADTLIPKIQDTTDIALDFNERYDVEELSADTHEKLARHLSKLGEALVARFEYEDQLLELLYQNESAAVA